MKAVLLALLLLFPLSARAASPEENYIAARDKYVAKFKVEGEVDDKITRDERAARADLETRLRAILGRVTIEGVPAEGKSNLDTLITGEMGFGLLDALVHQASEDAARLHVTTPTLAKRWLVAHRKWWDSNNVPQDLNAALKAKLFYTQAFSSDAAASHYADVPVTRPANASFSVAMLQARRQDNGPAVPHDLVVAVVRANRVFVWSAFANVTMIAACEAIWDEAVAKSEVEHEKYRKSELKDEKAFAESARLMEAGDAAMRRCFAQRARGEAFFPAVARQAQDLVDRLK